MFYAYFYSLSYDLKSDKEIYDYLKEKFVFNREERFLDYGRSFVHEYGVSCGKTNDENKIANAMSEIKKFIENGNLYYAYWMFYSLEANCVIDFETFYEIYVLFKDEITIQGYLLNSLTHNNRQKITDGNMINLLENSSDECLHHNYFWIINDRFYSDSLYDYLLKRGVEKEKLDTKKKEYYDRLKRLDDNNQTNEYEEVEQKRFLKLFKRKNDK